MFTEQPTMQDLFGQLGLDNSDAAIDAFIEEHRGMNPSRHIEQAPFWNESQKTFLQSALDDDAEWAEVIDQLNAQLHHD
ncbi:DUF2789 domain-containing protein [Alteromonas halophila]|uniref:DUF2789 domain-containing protein n=1 Tax=Alteromonas halophila TaxID=516698 RepID=A0A918JMC3_9ALTE|nr:DUF2789 domain-containing protein [Alteromonas halophila]GGW89818.1 hypothetical protein GCM10007391_25170 [Alteromonas halophila]